MKGENGIESKAKKLIRMDNLQEDFVGKGFHKLDDNLIEKRPPMIRWGRIYQKFSNPEKINYLQKLASTMNQAAHLIQGERNQLQVLCAKKEEQIVSIKAAMEQNMATLQTQMTKINEEKQMFNQKAALFNKREKEVAILLKRPWWVIMGKQWRSWFRKILTRGNND